MGMKVNKELLPVKGQYFLFNAGTAPVVPFLPTYAKQLGFSSVVVGTIYTVLPITGMLAKPLFGVIADRFNLKKAMFILFQILTAVSFLSILYVPESEQKIAMSFDCGEGTSFLKHCPQSKGSKCGTDQINITTINGTMHCEVNCEMNSDLWDTVCLHWNASQLCSVQILENLKFKTNIQLNRTIKDGGCVNFQVKKVIMEDDKTHVPFCPKDKHTHLFHPMCKVKCNSTIVDNLVSADNIDNPHIMQSYQFWLFFALLISSWVGMAVVVSIGDAICFGILGDEPQKYGNQRLWGAVGWGVFSVISGLVVDEMSSGQIKKDYSAVFYLAFFMLLLCSIVSNQLKYTQSATSVSILRDTGELLKSPRIAIFSLWCITVGLGTALIWNFLFWHLEDLAAEMEGCGTVSWMKTLQGLLLGIQCFGGEIPFFFLSGWIIKKISHVHAMSLVLLALSARFILYSLLSNPWWVLPIELLQGLTFGLFYSTMASYASVVAPPGAEATVQGLVGAIFEGVGVSLGSSLGGYLMKTVGGTYTFLYFGIGTFILCLSHIGAQLIIERRTRDGKKTDTQ